MTSPPLHLGDTLSSRRRIGIIITLGLLTGLGPFTVDMYLPAFPMIKSEFHLSDPQVQITLTATALGFALGQLLVGPVSDWWGRKWPLVAMNSLHVLSSLAVAVAPNIAVLIAMRGLQGVSAAGGAVVAMAMARDLFSGRRLIIMMSRLALITGLAPILAPLVGSAMVADVGWRGVFWVLAGYGLTVVLMGLFLLVETRPVHERTAFGLKPLGRAYKRVLGDRRFVGVVGVLAFGFTGLFSYVSTSSVLLQSVYGLSPRGFGFVFASCSVGVFFGIQAGARLGGRFGPARVLIASTTIQVLAAATALIIGQVSDSWVPLVPALFCFTLGFGLCPPNAQVLALEHHRADSGVAASIMGASNMGLASLAGPIIGSFPMTSAAPMALGMLGAAVLGTLVLWTVVRPLGIRVELD